MAEQIPGNQKNEHQRNFRNELQNFGRSFKIF